MMKKTILTFLILLSLPVALAQNFVYAQNDYCSDNTTLIHTRQVVVKVPERNITRTINTTEEEYCIMGCDPERNACNFPQWIYLFVIMGVIVASYLVFKFVIYPMVRR